MSTVYIIVVMTEPTWCCVGHARHADGVMSLILQAICMVISNVCAHLRLRWRLLLLLTTIPG